jgi:hypothetical protein
MKIFYESGSWENKCIALTVLSFMGEYFETYENLLKYKWLDLLYQICNNNNDQCIIIYSSLHALGLFMFSFNKVINIFHEQLIKSLMLLLNNNQYFKIKSKVCDVLCMFFININEDILTL